MDWKLYISRSKNRAGITTVSLGEMVARYGLEARQKHQEEGRRYDSK